MCSCGKTATVCPTYEAGGWYVGLMIIDITGQVGILLKLRLRQFDKLYSWSVVRVTD